MEQDSNLYFGGIPTAPDVEKLESAFGNLQVGQVITYKQVSDIIGVDWTKNRFRTVTRKWREKVRQGRNLEIACMDKARAFHVLDNPQRVGSLVTDYKGSIRKLTRVAGKAARIPASGLSSNELKTRDHINTTSSALALQAHTAAREIEYENTKVRRLVG